MTQIEMKDRTRQFALRIMKLVDAMPAGAVGRTIAGQIGIALEEAEELTAVLAATVLSIKKKNLKSEI